MLDLEFEATRSTHCSCCGSSLSIAAGWIYRDGAAFAAYRVVLAHDETFTPIADISMVLGAWGEHTPPGERHLFVVLGRPTAERVTFTVVDAEDTAWDGILGSPLSRNQALNSPRLGDVFSLCEAVVAHDARVSAYLDG